MANVQIVDYSYNYITVRIANLQYPQNRYGGFRVRESSNSSWIYISVGSSTAYYSALGAIVPVLASTTYTVQGQAQFGGVWYDVTSATVTTAPLPKVRPSNWAWYTPKVSGQPFTMIYYEWNNFMDHINAFRYYKDLPNYPYTSANSNNPFTATQYNQARNAIYGLTSAIPVYRNSGDIIYASDLNQLVTALNSVY